MDAALSSFLVVVMIFWYSQIAGLNFSWISQMKRAGLVILLLGLCAIVKDLLKVPKLFAIMELDVAKIAKKGKLKRGGRISESRG